MINLKGLGGLYEDYERLQLYPDRPMESTVPLSVAVWPSDMANRCLSCSAGWNMLENYYPAPNQKRWP